MGCVGSRINCVHNAEKTNPRYEPLALEERFEQVLCFDTFFDSEHSIGEEDKPLLPNMLHIQQQPPRSRHYPTLLRESREEVPSDAVKWQQSKQLRSDLQILDIFDGDELRLRAYDGSGGREVSDDKATSLRNSFTCLMKVRPDFSGNHEMPLIFCATTPYSHNKLFHLTLRDRRPYFGFGWNNLAANEALPENEWSWLAFAFDSRLGRRILINGEVVQADDKHEPFVGHGKIEIGHWFAGSFKGYISHLVLLQRVLSDREIRALQAEWGLDLGWCAWISGYVVDCRVKSHAVADALQEAIGAKRLRKMGVFLNRLIQLMDVLTDVFVAIDNATAWETLFSVIRLEEDVNMFWARINIAILIAPFVVTFLLLLRTAVTSLKRLGVPCPLLWYSVFGLPLMMIFKVWLLIANPLGETSRTPLTFLGAFDDLDLIAQAVFESPWQALVSAFMFREKLAIRSSPGKFPTMICISLISSLLSLGNSVRIIKSRQQLENSARHDLRTGWAELDTDELSFFGTVCLVLKAGMATTFTSVPGQPLADAINDVRWALKPPSTLETLILESNGLTHCTPLAEGLDINRSLLHLDLSGNTIEDWTPLTAALKSNSVLRFLCLKSNQISDVIPFGDMPKVNNGLQTLILAWNSIEDISSLALGLHVNKSLCRLNLSGNQIKDVKPLAEMLCINTSLQHLNLSSNQIESAGPLAEALKANEELELLCLGGNPIIDSRDMTPFGHVVF